MASVVDVVSSDTSEKMTAWVAAHSLLAGMDVLDQFLLAESEAAYELGYTLGEDWTNDRRVFELARSQF